MRNIVCILSLFLSFILISQYADASSIQIQGDRVVITTDDGRVIDTQNLPETKGTMQQQDNVGDGISIGGIHSNGGEIKNSGSTTKLENVTIINNGKKTVYPAKSNDK